MNWQYEIIRTSPNYYNFRVNEVYNHQLYPDLRYALRGSGPSFGIVTEFLYKVYDHPETLSCVAFVFLKDGRDLQKLVEAGQHGRYGISIMQPIPIRKPKPSKLVSIKSIFFYFRLKSVVFC